MSYEIIRNDITRVSADAIVNTANPHVQIGAGTDTAIHRAAGPELLEARRRIGELSPGEAAVTPAFGLNAKYVIHAVSPAWQGGGCGEEALLRRTYDAALQAALDHGCRSVAFPLLAAGTYGFPGEKAISVAISAFTEFLMAHEMHILLVLFNSSVFELAGHLFDDLRSYVDEQEVAQANAAEYGRDAVRVLEDGRSSVLYSAVRLRPDRRPARRAEAESLVHALSAPPAEADLSTLVAAVQMTFQQYLFRLIDERGMSDPQVYGPVGISKQQFSKIRNSADYQPTKNLALRLAVGLRLDYETAQRFLESAGYTLSPSSRRDIVIGYYLRKRDYNCMEIDMALYAYHQETLFSSKN